MRSTLLLAATVASLIAADVAPTGTASAAFVHSLARAPAV